MSLNHTKPEELNVRCCIAGGGPAGMMLGLLLARAGVDVVVLEKHADFLRDFRGDTIHPSTLEVMHELGILDDFLTRPHQEVDQIGGQIGQEFVILADFSHLPTRCKFIAFMPQWDFLDFLAQHAKRYPTFRLKMQTKVTGLIEEQGRVVGVHAVTPSGQLDVRCDLVVGADGRASVVRERAHLEVRQFGVPIDVLWFRLSRLPEDGGQTLGRIVDGKIMVMLYREDYWQCGFVIQKGEFERIKERGLESFREDIAIIAPFVRQRVGELKAWDDIRLLTVLVDRLRQWYRSGLVCIGDAAHAMSPIGGVGINLAIQDAVATANILFDALRKKAVSVKDLESLQKRRELPTRITQGAQVLIQNQVIGRVLGSRQVSLPWPVRLFQRFPVLRRIPARLIGIGFRPEHVRSPEFMLLIPNGSGLKG
ncbi:MAG: FAD-dependent oxidoreductase [Acidobacteriota bacterium]|nr:FAD-dependent oxidoreductase [Acidobacteriota bacterium]